MVIKVKNLNFTYADDHRGLVDVNLNIESGKKTAILGVNGSGKSTLLYHLGGIMLAQRGSVEVLDMEVGEKSLRNIRREVGFLFDYPDHQLFSTTVYQDIKFGLDNYSYPDSEKEDRIRGTARTLKIEELLDCPPYHLSLGQKKKVAIAGLIVLEPKILLCDEPFSGLDGPALTYFKELLDDWVEEGKTVIFSTHDVNLTYEWADNVIILKEGRVFKSGPVEDILTSEDIYLETDITRPMLYDLFQTSDYRPRNMEEAREYMSRNFQDKV